MWDTTETSANFVAFQKNIVKNKLYRKYFDWFELAEKTLKKISEKFEYDKYLKDKVFSDVIQRLKKGLAEDDSVGYINDYEEYIKGVMLYDKGIEKKVSEKYETQLNEAKEQIEEAKVQVKEAEVQVKEAEAKVNEAEAKAEKERKEKEEAMAKEEEAQLKIIELAKLLKGAGIAIPEIAKKTGLSQEEIEKL